MSTLNLSIRVSKKTCDDDLKKIVSCIRPDWPLDQVHLEAMQGGFINAMYKCWLQNDSDADDLWIIRIFDFKSDMNMMMIKMMNTNQTDVENEQEAIKHFHSLESQVMKIAGQAGLTGQMYANFENGYCYKYIPGHTVTTEIMKSTVFQEEIVEKIVKLRMEPKFRQISFPFKTFQEKMKLLFEVFLQQFLPVLKEKLNDSDNEYFKKIPDIDALLFYMKQFDEALDQFGRGDIVYSHNDLNPRNMIWNSKQNSLSLIDFESFLPQYEYSDWGTLFGWYCGQFPDYFDASQLPLPSFRINLLRQYLIKKHKYMGEQVSETSPAFIKQLWQLHVRVTYQIALFMLQIIFALLNQQFGFPMLGGEDIEQKCKDNPNLLGEFSFKVYQAFVKIFEEIKQIENQNEPPSDFC